MINLYPFYMPDEWSFVNVSDAAAIRRYRERAKSWPIDGDVFNAYLDSLIAHIRYVQEACNVVGCRGYQSDYHDQTKFKEVEFIGYALHFNGGGAPDQFAAAWLHHIHHNPHHWNHWIFADGFTPPGSIVERGLVEMPQCYALEMVADWMGASKAYTGSWNMAEWLAANMPRIRVHSNTAAYLREVLDAQGYADVVYSTRFGSEGGE